MMKYAVSLLLGLLCGVALFIIGLLYNPFIANRTVSPLSAGDTAVASLSYTAVPAKSIAFTNNGAGRLQPHPKGIRLLPEDTLEQTELMVAEMRDARGQTAGIGVKFSSRSERTNLLRGEALVNSAWYVHLPDRGSFFVEQAENYWPFIQNVLVPAYRNSANSWKGKWSGDLSAGPGALGAGRVTGVGGSLLGRSMVAVESLSVQAYSTEKGPVSAEGRLLIKMQPDDVTATD
jgi:hypothetical protein